MSNETFRATPARPVPLGPRLVGLAILCVTLFGLATLVGLFASVYA